MSLAMSVLKNKTKKQLSFCLTLGYEQGGASKRRKPVTPYIKMLVYAHQCILGGGMNSFHACQR